jgi:hypothetical protein
LPGHWVMSVSHELVKKRVTKAVVFLLVENMDRVGSIWMREPLVE